MDAFSDFDPQVVANYDAFEIDRLMATPGIIHSHKKIVGTVQNARTLIELDAEFGNIASYFATFASYSALRDDVHERFAFVGDLGCYYWLFRTGSRVPPFSDWIAVQSADHPRMREMVFVGRSNNTSSERPDFPLQ